ncbi:hypothetical protein BS78_01G200900 [Paspalum vaginatum]|nr:hypothetical protein BS78_01G200900 [Paspalum vaginatum]
MGWWAEHRELLERQDMMILQVLAPLPIGFAVFVVHLATIPTTGTGINPARSFGAAVVYNQARAWHDQWICWVGPLIGAAMATLYHEHALRASALKALGSFKTAGLVEEFLDLAMIGRAWSEEHAFGDSVLDRPDKAS